MVRSFCSFDFHGRKQKQNRGFRQRRILDNQGIANLSAYIGTACVGTSIFSENELSAVTPKTFILTDVRTRSVKQSAGASAVCSVPAIVLSENKRSSACSVNLTTVDRL